ncbi:MAG: ATP-dependent nuclease [Anaerobutyricum soehngenii]
MKITHVKIRNYRNLRDIDIGLAETVAIIGENNSGKSNFLKAITLPFLTDDNTHISKKLSWIDINNETKKCYYKKIILNQNKIRNDEITVEQFAEFLPTVVLLFVLINSLLGKETDIALDVLTIEEPEAHLCINNTRLMVSFLKAFTDKNKTVQLFYSTHSTEFINKMNLKNVVVLHNGKAYSFADELEDEDFAYLAKNPNLDLFKLFFSKKCILFEGISEELLIRSYIDSKETLSDIEVLSFHKGFKKIMNIWKKVNEGSGNKLGIVRDYDNQPNAKKQHDKYNDDKEICVRTTEYYTLEPEIVNTGDNYKILKNKYGDVFGWNDMTAEQLTEAWKNAKATDMFTICKDLASGELEGFQMPKHIQDVIDFLSQESEEVL